MIDDAIPSGRHSRRIVLGGAVAALCYAVVGPPIQATAAGATIRVRPLRDQTWIATTGRSLAQVSTGLGARLDVSSAAVRAGSVITVSFDERIYDLGTPILDSLNGSTVICRLIGPARRDASGLTTVTIALTQALSPDTTYSLSLGTRRFLRYPHDVIASPLPTSVHVADGSAATSSLQLAPSAAGKHALWGMVVGVGWQALYWGAGFHSWIPELVTLRAIGPAALPAGTIVSVELDARLFATARLQPLDRSRIDRTSDSSESGVLRARWVLHAALPAGQRVSASLIRPSANLSGPLPGLHPPTVSARAATHSVGQRTTGQESVSREDSAYDPTSRATYGFDLAPSLKPRKTT